MFCLLFAALPSAYAEETSKIYLDGVELNYSGPALSYEGNAVLLPAKVILEKIGVTVVWDGNLKVLKGYRSNSLDFVLLVDRNLMLFQGKEMQLNAVPRLKNGTVMITDEILHKLYMYTTIYNPESKTAFLSYQPATIVDPFIPIPNFKSNVPYDVYVKVFPQKPVVKVNPKKPQSKAPKGNIKGTITWQWNAYIGTKPDVNARVFLIPVGFDKLSLTQQEVNDYVLTGKIPAKTDLFYKNVDGFGKYEINGIPSGKYVIIVVSKNTTRNTAEKIPDAEANLIKSLIRDYSLAEKSWLTMNKHKVETITITANQTLDYSTDFGYTWR